MGLRSALVDTAYRLRKEASPKKVEGTTVYRNEESAPIRCRLTLTTTAERLEDGRSLTEPGPTMITMRRDNDGNELEWKASDRVRVESRELGTDLYFVDGEPEPMRKKRRIIGYQLRLKRVNEQPNPSQWSH